MERSSLRPAAPYRVALTTPSYPPTRIVIEVPFDAEPRVVDDGGFTGYFIEAVCVRVAMQHATTWEIDLAEEEEES